MTTQPRSTASERPRILISGGLAVGGPQTHLAVLCADLVRVGADVTIASASTNWPLQALEKLRTQGMRVVVSPFGFGPFRFLGKLWAFLVWPFLLHREYDVLYCVGEGRMHLWASRFVTKSGWRIYHELVECPRENSVAAEVAGRMDAIIANSRKVGDEISDRWPDLPVRIIPFLTSSAPMPPPAPRERVSQRELRVAFLGRLVPHKRPGQLIASWPVWNASAPIGPARLDLYGGDYDGQQSDLQKQITALGLQESVRLHGTYTTGDLAKIFAETDIVVLPSQYEGLPLVLVEAMQRGVPVVATSAGGTAELGEDNPDVIITEGTGWPEFEAGLRTMAERVRAGNIDSGRLHDWTEARYGFETVAEAWREALLDSGTAFTTVARPVVQTKEAHAR
jgi:glycosyltransferase involved in cell wall biosynthesis